MQEHTEHAANALQLPERLTQRELAQKLGVSQATISRALSGNRRHSEQTRDDVLGAAADMGYRPDPALSSLNAYRQTRRPIRSGQTLAWLGSSDTPPSATDTSAETTLFAHASTYAASLGYGMEYICRQTTAATPDKPNKLEKSLTAKGVSGIIFGSDWLPIGHCTFDVSNFAAVQIGSSDTTPAVDRIDADYTRDMAQCYRALYEHGKRRIGLILNQPATAHSAGQWLAAYLLQQLRHPALPALPPFTEANSPQNIHQWLATHQPDAIITTASGCLPHLLAADSKMPANTILALLDYPPRDPAVGRFCGTSQPTEAIARCAVDVLVARIRNNQRGIPAEHRLTLLAGIWQQGSSLPALAPTQSKNAPQVSGSISTTRDDSAIADTDSSHAKALPAGTQPKAKANSNPSRKQMPPALTKKPDRPKTVTTATATAQPKANTSTATQSKANTSTAAQPETDTAAAMQRYRQNDNELPDHLL